MEIYNNTPNYLDQVTNGYNQMNLGQSTDYSSYLGVNAQQGGQQYDPLNDMYFQSSTNYQPVIFRHRSWGVDNSCNTIFILLLRRVDKN